jgi:hypothetical protein
MPKLTCNVQARRIGKMSKIPELKFIEVYNGFPASWFASNHVSHKRWQTGIVFPNNDGKVYLFEGESIYNFDDWFKKMWAKHKDHPGYTKELMMLALGAKDAGDEPEDDESF